MEIFNISYVTDTLQNHPPVPFFSYGAITGKLVNRFFQRLKGLSSCVQSVWDKTPRVSKIANSGVLSKGVFFSSNRHSLKRRGVWDKTPFQLGGHSGAAGKLT